MARQESVFTRELMLSAIRGSPKLDPRLQIKNPVMFIVELSAARSRPASSSSTSCGAPRRLCRGRDRRLVWLTVLFANFAEANAETRKAQANAFVLRDDDDRAQAGRDGVGDSRA
jgi:K+-transporting ATPase ATPase B chain